MSLNPASQHSGIGIAAAAGLSKGQAMLSHATEL
jgi:hypothetical protein